MGYDLQRFKNEVSEDLICSICTGVLMDPVSTPDCDHTFCRDCISDWLNVKQRCPIDNSVVKLEDLRSVSRIIKNFLAKLLISCDFVSNGCNIFVKTEDLNAHTKECAHNPHALVPCEKNCGLDIPKSEVNDHNCVKELRKYFDAIKLENEEIQEKFKKLNQEHTKSSAEYAKLAEEHKRLAEDHTKLIEKQTKLEKDHAILISEHKKLQEEQTKSNSKLKQNFNQLKKSLELQISSTLGEIRNLHELKTVQEFKPEAQEKEDSKPQLEHLACEESHLISEWWKQLNGFMISGVTSTPVVRGDTSA